MTTPAQRQQIIQRIVPQLFRRGNTSAINMMDMQIFRGSAVLAGEVVSFQGFLAIASKVVVVFGLANVLASLGVLRQSLASLQRSAFFDASRAMLLRTRRVGKISSAFNALKRAAYRYCTFSLAKLSQMDKVLLLPVNGTAFWATLLHRARGLVEHLADEALALLKAVAGLPVSSQRTRLASLQVGRCFGHLRPAIRAIENAVSPRFHNLNTTLSVL